MSVDEPLGPELRRKAGHYEILGETYAKFEFFQKGWNPYSRFLDVDKVDLILRRRVNGLPDYREVQVTRNAQSIDGLPALRPVQRDGGGDESDAAEVA